MKLKKLLSEEPESDLIEDPNWYMVTTMPFKVPVNYQQAKARINEEMRLLNFNDISEIFQVINDSHLRTRIDIADYQQYFNPSNDDEFHVDDVFSNVSDTTRIIRVNNKGLFTFMNRFPEQGDTGEGQLIPQDVVAKLQKIFADNKLVLFQALDSYLRDHGRSIREFGMRNIPIYGM